MYFIFQVLEQVNPNLIYNIYMLKTIVTMLFLNNNNKYFFITCILECPLIVFYASSDIVITAIINVRT